MPGQVDTHVQDAVKVIKDFLEKASPEDIVVNEPDCCWCHHNTSAGGYSDYNLCDNCKMFSIGTNFKEAN